MRESKFYETRAGFWKVSSLIRKLEHDLHFGIPQALNAAAALGDRSENAEYDAAKQWQRDCQAELRQLKEYLSSVAVIEKQDEYNSVLIGSTVEVLENDSLRKVYSIVGKQEADAAKGLLFYGSPIAQAFFNKKIGEIVQFKAPNGQQHKYQILSITSYEADNDEIEFSQLKDIGFYPVVNRANLVKKFLTLGIKIIQLRIKDLSGEQLEEEIKKACEYSREFNANLFINEYWKLALKHHARGIQLKYYEVAKLTKSELADIARANMYFGISVTDDAEIEEAIDIKPSYILLGNIFSNNRDSQNTLPRGLEYFKTWRAKIQGPLIASGGINLTNAKELLDASADGIAVMSDICNNENPDNKAQEWLEFFKKRNK